MGRGWDAGGSWVGAGGLWVNRGWVASRWQVGLSFIFCSWLVPWGAEQQQQLFEHAGPCTMRARKKKPFGAPHSEDELLIVRAISFYSLFIVFNQIRVLGPLGVQTSDLALSCS